MNWVRRAVAAMAACAAMSAATGAFGDTPAAPPSEVPTSLVAYTEKVLLKAAATPSIVRTQQAAASAEQMASSTEELSGMAQQLQGMAAGFKLEEESPGALEGQSQLVSA